MNPKVFHIFTFIKYQVLAYFPRSAIPHFYIYLFQRIPYIRLQTK